MTAQQRRFLRDLVVGHFVELGVEPNPHAKVYREFASQYPSVPTTTVRTQVAALKADLGL